VPKTLIVSNSRTKGPEIFASLQGEGLHIGRPTAFLRLAQCNLNCTWCDTRYTWDWQSFDIHVETKRIDIVEIENAIDNLGMSRLVVTGGEPLIQQASLLPLMCSLHDKGYSMEMETNGTIFPDPELLPIIECWNVSPKISNSLIDSDIRFNEIVLREFVKLPNANFKFVVQKQDDICEVNGLAEYLQIPIERIFLMPEGETAANINEISGWLAPFCINEGYRFTTRLHILLWGDERGR
jgi:7-carboxy-7-deazaguanine synthase